MMGHHGGPQEARTGRDLGDKPFPRRRFITKIATGIDRKCVVGCEGVAHDVAMATTRRADMFTADGRPSDDDPREHRARLGDERTTLTEALRALRLTLELKCAGLDAEAMARRAVEPSTMSLLGLVRHLAEVERGTFRRLMAGPDVPRLYCSETDRDGDFDGAVADPDVVAEAWAAWRAEVDFSTRFVTGAPSLDITAEDAANQHGSGGGAISLREVLVGMIEEYARHMGHVDLLRERIDGRIGQ
jgi:hypothetical protein